MTPESNKEFPDNERHTHDSVYGVRKWYHSEIDRGRADVTIVFLCVCSGKYVSFVIRLN